MYLLTLLLTYLFKSQATDNQYSTRFFNSKIVKFFTSPKYIISPFTFYLPETNLVIGGGIKRFYHFGNDSTTRTSNIAASLQYSLNGQYSLRSQYQVFTKNEKYYTYGFLGYKNHSKRGKMFWLFKDMGSFLWVMFHSMN